MNKIMLENLEKFSSALVSLVTVFAIISGGIFTVVEYLDHKEDVKQKNSLKLVTEYHSKDSRLQREKLDEAWELGHPILVATLSGATSRLEKADAFNKYVEALVSKEDLSSEINYIMSFYERVAACVTSGLCDKVIIDKFFFNDGRAYFRKFSPYICTLRAKWKDDSIWVAIELYFNINGGKMNNFCG